MDPLLPVSKLNEKVLERFDYLLLVGRSILSERSIGIAAEGDETVSDVEMAHQWGTSCLNLVARVFERSSDHYNKLNLLFATLENLQSIKKFLGIVAAAKDDYERGFIFEARTLIEAEVFGDFLEQAEYLFGSGYIGPAAVIAGAVLEGGLRELCIRKDVVLPHRPKLDAMNNELAKRGVYTLLVQKRVTMLADIRNKAAHGMWADFNADDVKQMITQIRSFMHDHFK